MTWDLKDNAGNDVPNGYYSAFVIANSSDEYASSSPLQLTVLRRATAK
jgi:flagellar hook assembly protein FlgD